MSATIPVLLCGRVIMRFFRELMIGDGIDRIIGRIIRICFRAWFRKYLPLRIPKLVILHRRLLMELAIMAFRGVGIRIIGGFGLGVRRFSRMPILLGLLIVSLVRKHCQFGKLSVKLLMRLIENTLHKPYWPMKDMVVGLALFKITWINTWDRHLTLNYKLIKVDFYKLMQYK